MELKEAIFKRRSIRKFTDYIVSDEEIKEILEAGRWAPSWANTQTSEFIVVKDKGLIKKVTETYSEKNPAKECSSECSVIIVGVSKLKVAGCRGGENRTKFNEWFMFDQGIAFQNMSLRIHDLGLGSVMVGSMDHDACKDLLKVPEGYEVVLTLPIGKPDIEADGVTRPPNRKERDLRIDKF